MTFACVSLLLHGLEQRGVVKLLGRERGPSHLEAGAVERRAHGLLRVQVRARGLGRAGKELAHFL